MEQHTVPTEPLHVRVGDVTSRRGKPPWSEMLLADGRNLAVLICNEPGQTNDAHVHPDFNEWWIVLKGELVWEIGDYEPVRAGKGDVVFCPAGLRHHIRTEGDESSLRLGITKPGSSHDDKGHRGTEILPLPDRKLPPNLLHTGAGAIQAHFGAPPWSEPIVADDRNRGNLICHGPGMTNNAHWHPDFDEWWAVLKGELTWDVGSGRPLIHARDGDIVFVPKGMRHHISTVGTGLSWRLAVTTPDAPHIYTDDDESAPPPRE